VASSPDSGSITRPPMMTRSSGAAPCARTVALGAKAPTARLSADSRRKNRRQLLSGIYDEGLNGSSRIKRIRSDKTSNVLVKPQKQTELLLPQRHRGHREGTPVGQLKADAASRITELQLIWKRHTHWSKLRQAQFQNNWKPQLILKTTPVESPQSWCCSSWCSLCPLCLCGNGSCS